MALTKVFQKYLSNIFISIVQQENEWVIYSKIVKNGAIKNKLTEKFESQENDSIPKKMQIYLEKLQADYNFAYTALFLDSMGQGAINGTTAKDFEKHSVDMKSVSYFHIDNAWTAYVSFIDIKWTKKLFENVGLDFIYSPFMVQNSLIKSQKIKEKPTLYILNHENSVTISIYENSNLLFGSFFKTTTDENLDDGDEDWDNAKEEEGIEDLVELDTMYDDEMGALAELDDLDSNEESTDFEDMETKESDLGHFTDEENADNSDLELFGRDVIVYKFLVSSLKEFYKNSIYKSNFIDTIVIFDGYEVSSELIDMIENDLLMDIEMNKINISETVCDMSIKEALQ